MQQLPLKLLEPGMVVAREILGEQGLPLLRPNTELDAALIVMLGKKGVSQVTVKGTPVQMKDYLPKTLEEKIEENDLRFSIHEGNALMERLRVLVKAHLIDKDRRIRELEAEDAESALEARRAELADELARGAEEEENQGAEGTDAQAGEGA